MSDKPKSIEELGKLDAPEGPGMSVPTQPLDYGEGETQTFSELADQLRRANQTSFEGWKPKAKTKSKAVTTPVKKRVMRSAPVKPTPAIVDPKKEYGPSGMSLYDAGVEKVRAEYGDEAADAARKDMSHADFMRARDEYGEMSAGVQESQTTHSGDKIEGIDYPPGFDYVETGDDQTWLIDKETGDVTRTTGMSAEEIQRMFSS